MYQSIKTYQHNHTIQLPINIHSATGIGDQSQKPNKINRFTLDALPQLWWISEPSKAHNFE